ncbi:hypothetical protein E2562_036256 [Oryza meyeriana var. granulata]|uniref:O-methyltransferase domain-containing protein n=1 Tax=Oryza meyeriana var. granulata TaxID=110450 RepID=A0A6G1CBA7_9ORYZ|nr:hypothetical protein E2562_036256 [Oryza meyeriana var. granulata]
MAAQALTIEVPNDAELMQAQADLWRHSLYYLTSMGLRCAVELSIPTTIHRLGGAASVSDLMAELSLPENKLPFLQRLMRVLVTAGVFTADGSSGSTKVEHFRLTPLSRILVDGVVADEHHSQRCFVLGATSRHYVEAAFTLAEWFKKDLPSPVPSPFEDLHGARLFDESTPLLDPELDAVVNEGLAAHDNLGIGTLLRECSDLFKGVQSLTDCCGRHGATARAIVKAFPHIKCTVLDLPRLVEQAPRDGVVNYVAGDAFHCTVPPAQAVMLKLVLHHLSDEDSVKILAQCRKAIPSRKDGGKAIVIDILVGPSLGPVMFEAQLMMDMLMMVNTRGRQRDEKDWHDLFMKAGFSDYKIVKKLGARAVFEVYP